LFEVAVDLLSDARGRLSVLGYDRTVRALLS